MEHLKKMFYRDQFILNFNRVLAQPYSASSMTNQQLVTLLALFFTGRVQCCVPVPVLTVQDGVV